MKKEKLYKINGYIIYFMLVLYIAIDPILKILGFINHNSIFEKPIKYILFICLVMYIYFNIKHILKFKGSKLYFIALLGLTLIFFVYFISYPIIIKYPYIYIPAEVNQIVTSKQYYFSFLKDKMFMFLIFWIIGSNVKVLFITLMNKKIKILSITFYLMLISLFLFVQITQHIDLIETIFKSNEMYLFVGDTFAIFSLIILYLYKNNLYKIIISINSIFWLYKIGSRTSLYCFFIVIFFIVIRYFVRANINRKIILILLFNLFALILSTYIINIFLSNGVLSPKNRMARGIISLSEDGSYQSRLIQFDDGFNDIKQYWLTGRVFREIERTGEIGDYMHNILSFWVEFGILPFSIVLILSIYCFVKNLKTYFCNTNYEINDLVFAISCCVFLEIFVLRSYYYAYIWFSLAASLKSYYYKPISI